MVATAMPDATIHGFDTFSGIPEQWHLEAAGSYSTHGARPESTLAFNMCSDLLHGLTSWFGHSRCFA
eukprot:5334031-Pleurochrysis_carterae.AAC.1